MLCQYLKQEKLYQDLFKRILKKNPMSVRRDDKIFFSDEGYITINLHAHKDLAEISLYLVGSVTEICAEADVDGYVLDSMIQYSSVDVDKLFAAMENRGML